MYSFAGAQKGTFPDLKFSTSKREHLKLNEVHITTEGFLDELNARSETEILGVRHGYYRNIVFFPQIY